ncbi:MAG: hypothetical protein ABFR82_03395 [Nitrospirota bacterium]
MKKYPLIKNIAVDVSSLLSIVHSCTPEICSSDESCCGSFQVCVDGNELQQITGCMPMAAGYSEGLKSDDEYLNVFEKIEQDLFSIDDDDSGVCVFAYRGGKEETLCSLHSTAIEMDYQPEEVKPKDCVLWPLALSEGDPLCLTIDDDAFLFQCNRSRSTEAAILDPGIASIIKTLYGNDFLEEINEYIARMK